MILGVAIKVGELMVCLPKPNRHGDCIHHAVTVLKQKPPVSSRFDEQGFYTDEGLYLDRIEAAKYARSHNQILENRKHLKLLTHNSKQVEYLFSEDLW